MKQKIYQFIKEFITANKYTPTIREICQGVGLKSTSSVHHYLNCLRYEGLIDFKDYMPRTITIKEPLTS